jgi:hypothetical protein
METKNVKEKPKVALINEQFKGELVGQKSTEDATSLHIANRVQAHDLATDVNMVNEQVRGELAGTSCTHARSSYHVWFVSLTVRPHAQVTRLPLTRVPSRSRGRSRTRLSSRRPGW